MLFLKMVIDFKTQSCTLLNIYYIGSILPFMIAIPSTGVCNVQENNVGYNAIGLKCGYK